MSLDAIVEAVGEPYYRDEAVAIYHADCRDILPLIPPVDLVLTDPPYPDYEKGWSIPDGPAIISGIKARAKLVFWPAMHPWPGVPVAEHIWHKPNGNSSYHYERILAFGDVSRTCRVYRVAAILPNYVQYADEAVDHPTQKPLRLCKALMQLQDAHIILDPFMGSGTTLRAAKDLGRYAIGIEIEEKYCEIAAKRMSQMVMPLEAQ